MNVVVLKPFVDAKTGKPYNTGYIYSTDDAARAAALKDAGYIDGEIKKVAKPKTTGKKESPD